METTNCLLGETYEQLQELVALGFKYELDDCKGLSKYNQLYLRKRRRSLVKSIWNAAKRTTSKAYLRSKLRRYKYVSKYAKLNITL